jgi:hypothetical protein|tara:strand:+ start:58 stop:453 length:396 start_codon:yes stop_codon:yes gene_type:complete
MSKKEKFVNYNSEFISTEQYKELLTYIKKSGADSYLTFSVKDSGSDGMVEGEDAETWFEVRGDEKNQKIYFMMNDNDGESELETYDMTLSGLYDAIDAVLSLQDQVQTKEFFNSVHELLKQFKQQTQNHDP